MNPYCPHCPTTALVRARYARENIDSCPSCEGLWFQNHELNSAIADFDNGDDDPDFIRNLGAPLGISFLDPGPLGNWSVHFTPKLPSKLPTRPRFPTVRVIHTETPQGLTIAEI